MEIGDTLFGNALADIALTTPEGGMVRAADFAGQKLVLFFYPKDDTPGCTTENLDFTALVGEFAAAGVALLGMVRTTLLIGADGRIARIWCKVKVKGHAAEVLAAAKAL